MYVGRPATGKEKKRESSSANECTSPLSRLASAYQSNGFLEHRQTRVALLRNMLDHQVPSGSRKSRQESKQARGKLKPRGRRWNQRIDKALRVPVVQGKRRKKKNLAALKSKQANIHGRYFHSTHTYIHSFRLGNEKMRLDALVFTSLFKHIQ